MDELLPDEPVGGFDHRAVVRVARPGKGTRDAEHVEHAFDAFPGESAAAIRVEHLDLIQREAQCIASMFVGRVRQCFSVVWADGFPRCRHRFPVM